MKTLKLNNLRKEINNEVNGYKKGRLQQLAEAQSIEEIKSNWQLKDYLTATTKRDGYFNTVNEMKIYLKDRITKAYDKKANAELTKFDDVLNSGKLIAATITVEWKKNRTWGANPRAEARYNYTDADGQRQYNTVNSSSIGGCGYDKLSTAVAEVLNQIKPIKRSLYIKKNAKAKLKNREVFSYGSGYGVLPTIEGGVGVSCYPSIFEAIGYKFETITSGKMCDVFKITKK